ncbi:MAG: type II toxin-antitoxin system VapC family toxin [Crocosphaera sp.]
MANNLICVDANFIVRLVNIQIANSAFITLWEEWRANEITVVAPTLFYYEVTNALYRMSKAEQMTIEQAKEALIDALSFNITLYGHQQLPNFHQTAFELANQFNLPASYDAHYLALAQHLNCDFYTGDKRLYNTVKNQISWIKLVT